MAIRREGFVKRVKNEIELQSTTAPGFDGG
jgi:hypothetical protein